MRKLFTFIALAAMAFASQGNVLTVCDGTAVSYEVPYDGYWHSFDGGSPSSQMIYPAQMLTDMIGAKITQVKFYSSRINFSDGKLWLGMGNTTQTEFTEKETLYVPFQCGSMTPVNGATELVFNFVSPYIYEGGNLVLDVYLEEPGDSGESGYYGVNMDYNSSLYTYPTSEFMENEFSNFLPKITFTYEPITTPVDPSEKTGAPTFQGFTEDGIHGYFVEIIPTEESIIYYRVIYPNGTESDWTIYEKILNFEGDGKYRVEAYAVASGKAASEQIAYEFVVSPITGIEETVSGKTVAGVRYFNLAGQEMSEANGLTIMVTTYTDGTTSAVKVVK